MGIQPTRTILAATDYGLKKQYDFKTIKIEKEYEKNLSMLPCEGAKIQTRIFETFFTTKPVGEVTGLGLSISYFNNTENHRGTMHEESQSRAGTEFIIRLPLGRLKSGKLILISKMDVSS